MNETRYKVGEFAKLIGKTVSTLQRWDRDGILVAHRTEGNRRYYTYDQFIKLKFKELRSAGKGKTIAYCRVMQPGNTKFLELQQQYIQRFSKEHDMTIDLWIHDTGSDDDFRPGFNKLFQMVVVGDVKLVLVLTKWQLLRWGFTSIAALTELHDTQILSVTDYIEDYDRELVYPVEEDMIVIGSLLKQLRTGSYEAK